MGKSGRTKQDVARDITSYLGVQELHFSTGSTEPRELFDLAASILGLGDVASLTKPQAAQKIVEASGQPWFPQYESAGGTVTKSGLEAVLKSVLFFCGLPFPEN